MSPEATAAGARLPVARVRRAVTGLTALLACICIVAASGWLMHHRSSTPSNPWLAKVHAVHEDFPPGYQVTETDTTVITQQYLDGLQAPMQDASFIPAECAGQSNAGSSLPVGATIEGLRGQFNDRLITVAALEAPTPMTPPPNLPQCAAVAFVAPGFIHGFLSHVAAPTMPGTTATQGLRMSATVTNDGHDTNTIQYAYVATLDDRHLVSVTITGTPLLGQPNDIDPTPAAHLLIEAVGALRR